MKNDYNKINLMFTSQQEIYNEKEEKTIKLSI